MISIALIFVLGLLAILLSIAFVFQIDVIGTLIVFVIIFFMYLLAFIWTTRRERQNVIKENLIIARNYLLDNDVLMIIIFKDDKIIWANDYVYKEFSILLRDKRLSAINYKELDHFEYHNNIYKTEKLSDQMVIITNDTNNYRERRILVENQTNIGLLQIDNYNYLETVMNNSEFVNVMSHLKSDLIDYFEENKIFYEEVEEYLYQIIIPSSVLNEKIKAGFKDLYAVANSYHGLEYETTLTLGVATNQKSIYDNGTACRNAFNLALTRGGGQVVVFDGTKRRYIGGTTQGIKGSLRLKARILGNTISSLISGKDVIYLFTHQRPDSDGIASLFLMSKLIKHYDSDVIVRIMLDTNIDDELQNIINSISDESILYDVVIDKTKSNLAVICDTQSNEFVANKNIIDQINDKIIIDHHQTPLNFIEDSIFSWVETNSSSTTEMITEMLIARDVKLDDQTIANLALLGIMTDSSNLMYRTDENTLDVMSYLVNSGGNVEHAIAAQYVTPDIFKLKQQIISNINFSNDVAIIKTDLTMDDFILSMVVNEALEIKGIEVAIIISEGASQSKVKIRSKSRVNVKNIIENYGGGGHPQQAAGNIKNSQIDDLINDLINRS